MMVNRHTPTSWGCCLAPMKWLFLNIMGNPRNPVVYQNSSECHFQTSTPRNIFKVGQKQTCESFKYIFWWYSDGMSKRYSWDVFVSLSLRKSDDKCRRWGGKFHLYSWYIWLNYSNSPNGSTNHHLWWRRGELGISLVLCNSSKCIVSLYVSPHVNHVYDSSRYFIQASGYDCGSKPCFSMDVHPPGVDFDPSDSMVHPLPPLSHYLWRNPNFNNGWI